LGIIQKQAIKGTVYTYIGAFLGLINMVILFPTILSPNEVGLVSILLAYAMILSQFGSLGFNGVTTRMFPYFKTKDNKHNGYLFLLVIVTLIGFLLVSGIFLFLKPVLFENNNAGEDAQLLLKYFFYIIPILFFTLLFNAFDHYNKVLFNAVRGTVLREFVARLLILVAIILYVSGILNFDEFLFAYFCAFCSPTLIISFLLIKDKQFNLRPNFKFLTKDMKKTLISVSLFGLISSATGIMTLNIDKIMIKDMLEGLSLSSVGIYATAFYFGTLMILPARSLSKISSAIVADSWKNNDIENINKIYYKSALAQLTIGLFLLIGIWGNIDNILSLLPDKYEAGKYVILLISLAYLMDMASGVGGAILVTSRKYRVHAVFTIILITLLIVTNYILIPKYQIIGAAMASLISKLVYNFIRFIYLKYRFKLQPYDYKSILVIIVALAVYGITYLIPHFSSFYIDIIVKNDAITVFYLDIIIRSIIITTLFVALILSLKISEDINNSFKEYWNKFKSILTKS